MWCSMLRYGTSKYSHVKTSRADVVSLYKLCNALLKEICCQQSQSEEC